MSYKKFTRNHGQTSRVYKYKWSTPDAVYRLNRYPRTIVGSPHPDVRIDIPIEVRTVVCRSWAEHINVRMKYMKLTHKDAVWSTFDVDYPCVVQFKRFRDGRLEDKIVIRSSRI